MTNDRTAERFSLLLPVWAGDHANRLREAFASAVDEQTLRPDQAVIVLDGPVPPAIRRAVRELAGASEVAVDVVELPHNVGLGPALDAGLARCRHDIVARMDADDIAVPERFAVQIPLMADADIVGAGLYEFRDDVTNVIGQRTPPLGAERIARYARAHDPFNHPTVVYRRAAVQAVGGYGDLRLMEDYWLFARMLADGARAANVADPLVYYRVGPEAFKRRGGRGLLRSEIDLQRKMRDAGLITPAEYVRNVAVRGGYRLVPWPVRRVLYRVARRSWDHRPARPARPAQPTGPSIQSSQSSGTTSPADPDPGRRLTTGAL